jgi:hypothetical protein
MANTLIHENRRLRFPLDTLVDALIELEDKQGHWPSKATVVGATIDHETTTDNDRVILSIHRPDGDEVIERRYSLAMIAAAIVNYCVTLRVPLPRNSTKSIQVLPDGVALVLENTLILQCRHEELSTLPAGSVPPPANTAAAAQRAPADAASLPPGSPPPASAPAGTADAPATTAAPTPDAPAAAAADAPGPT